MPRFVRVAATVTALALALTGCALFEDDDGGGDATPVTDGRALYSQNCASCHGASGQGGIGPALGGGAVADKFTVEEHTAIVVGGQGGMPPFGERLSEDQIDAKVAFERDELGNDPPADD